jgi:hypothetical protein
MSTLLEIGVGANDCKCNREHRLNVPFEARNLVLNLMSNFIPSFNKGSVCLYLLTQEKLNGFELNLVENPEILNYGSRKKVAERS